MSVIAATGQELPAAIREPRLRRLYGYWHAARGGRRCPARRDIDPLDIPYMLGNLMLVDVLYDPQRFRVRLHGTAMVARAGYDLTGKQIEELPISEFRAYVLERCRQLVRTPEPLWVQHDSELDGRRFHYQALWLPLAEDAVSVSMLMCALIYEPSGDPRPPL